MPRITPGYRSRALTIAALLAVFPHFSQGVTPTTYIAPIDGEWTNPLNWSNGVPDSTAFDAIINSLVPRAVELTADETINNFTLTSPNTLALYTALTLTGPSSQIDGKVIGGEIQSVGGTVSINNGAELSNLSLSGNGIINLGSVALRGMITNSANLTTFAGSTLSFLYPPANPTSTLDNSGIVRLNNSTLTLSTTTYFTGSGTVEMSGAKSSITSFALNPQYFTNTATIMGEGRIGENLQSTNLGTIIASTGTLTVMGITNSGILRADGGTLVIPALVSIKGSFTAPNNGVIEAVNGSTVIIGQDFVGGTIRGLTGGNVIISGSLQNVNFTGHVTSSGAGFSGIINSPGTITLQAPTAMGVLGPATLNNKGLVEIEDTGGLYIPTNTTDTVGSTLTGGGSVFMKGPGSNITQRYNLATDNLIYGQGIIATPLINSGTITATTGTLTIEPKSGTSKLIRNIGTIRADGGTLIHSGNGDGAGVIEATNGSQVIIKGTLTGGSLLASNAGIVSLSSNAFSIGVPIQLSTGGLNLYPAAAAQLSSIIWGNGTLSHLGAGTTTLVGSSSYTGVTSLLNGVLVLGDPLAIGSASTINFGGGTLRSTSANFLDYSSRFSSSLGQQFKIDNNGQNLTFNTPLTSTGGTFTKLGLGTLTFAAINGYDGQTTVSGGALRLGIDDAIFSGPVMVNGATAQLDLNGHVDTVGVVSLDGTGSIVNGTLTSTGSFELKSGTVTAALAGNGISVNKTTAGTVTLLAANTYDGGTNINGGILVLGNSGALSSSGVISFGGGTLRHTASNTSDYSGRFSSVAGQQFRIDTNGQTVNLTNPLVSAGGTFTKLGLGTLTLNGANSYDGLTSIVGGVLRISVDNGIASGPVSINGVSAVFDLNGHVDTVGTITVDGRSSLIGGTLTSTGSFEMKSGTVSASLSGIGIPLNKTTAGTVLLSGNNTYGGGTNLAGGVLLLGSASAVSGSGAITFTGGTLGYTLGNTTDYSSRFNTNPGQLYRIDTNGQSVNFVTPMASTGGTFIKSGLGTLTLNAANTYDGLTTVSGGVLQYGLDNAISNGPISVNGASAVLDLNGHNVTVGTLTLDGGGMIIGGTMTSGVNYQLKNGTVNAPLAGAGIAVIKTTAGTVVLAGTNTYDGGSAINGGALQFAVPGAMPSSGVISFGGGALLYGASNLQDYSGRFSQGVNQFYAVNTGGQSIDFSTGLNSAGSTFTKSGLGTLTLNAVNLYPGLTTISGGVLKCGVDNAIAAGPLTVNGVTAVLDLDGHLDSSVGTVTLDGGGTIKGGTLTSAVSYQLKSGGVSASLAGAGISLTKTTTGTVTLTGINTYTGGTTINGGVLVLGSPGALGATGSIGFGGGTLQFTGANTTDYSNRFSTTLGQIFNIDTNGQTIIFNSAFASNGSKLFKSGMGTLELTATISKVVPTTVSAGVLRIGVDNALGGGSLTINGANAVLDLTGHTMNAGDEVILDGGGTLTGGTITGGIFRLKQGFASTSLAGPGQSIIKSTPGTVVLTGNNSYSYQTQINDGVLVLGSPNALGNTSQIDFAVFGGGTLRYTAANTTDYSSKIMTNGIISIDTNGQTVSFGSYFWGSGFNKLGLGTLTINSDNDCSGPLNILVGLLRYGIDEAIGGGPVNVNGSTAWFDLNSHYDLGGTITLDGGGSITNGNLASYDSFEMKDGLVSANISGIKIPLNPDPIIPLNKSTAGTVTLTGNNDYNGGTNIGGGVLVIGSPGALSSIGTISFSGGALRFTSANTSDYSPRFSNAVNQLYSIDTNGQIVTFGSPLTSGGGSLTKLGTGTLVLTAANTYTGGTTITEGTIKLTGNGRIGSGNLYIGPAGVLDTSAVGHLQFSDGSVLSGNGNIMGEVWINTNGKISPGNSPGELFGDSEQWGSGGLYDWQLRDGGGTPGVGFDTITLGGTISLTATPAAPFIINLISLGSNNNPGLANFDSAQNYGWPILTAANGIGSLDLSAIQLNLSGFQNNYGGGDFSLSANGNQLWLNFTAGPVSVPEPGSAFLLLALSPFLLRRRSVHRQDTSDL